MIQCAMLISGSDSVIQSCVGAGEIHLNLWEDMMGFLLIINIKRLIKCMYILRTKCLEGLLLNEAKCEEYANSSIPTIVNLKEKHSYGELAKKIREKGASEALMEFNEEEKVDE